MSGAPAIAFDPALGCYRVSMRYEDAQGNVTHADVLIRLDRTAPFAQKAARAKSRRSTLGDGLVEIRVTDDAPDVRGGR